MILYFNRYFGISLLLIGLLTGSCSGYKIPGIYLDYDAEDQWTAKSDCSLQYREGEKVVFLDGKIKRRGGMSVRYGKPSFSLEFDTKFPLCGLPADDDWIINANYIDKTFMRHKISYDLFREMGKNNLAPRTAYAELFWNGSYIGLFAIMEEVNGGFVGLDKSDPEAAIFKDPPFLYEEVFEWTQEPGNYYQQKFPDIESVDKTYVMDELKDFLFNSTDEEFDSMLLQYFDIDNLTDWHLLLLLTNNSDGLKKNFYLYKKDSESPWRFAIWDYDHSFGRDGDNEINMMEREINCEKAVLLRRLMASEKLNYRQMLADKYFSLRKNGIFSLHHIENMIKHNDRLIHSALERNFTKWPVDDKWYFDDNSYEEEIGLIITYLEMRLPYLDNYFRELAGEN